SRPLTGLSTLWPELDVVPCLDREGRQVAQVDRLEAASDDHRCRRHTLRLQILEIVRSRNRRISEREDGFQRLLRSLLGVKTHRIVLPVVVQQAARGREIAPRLSDPLTRVTDLIVHTASRLR